MSVQAIGGLSLLIPAIVWIGVACGRDSEPVQVTPYVDRGIHLAE